MIKQSFLKKQIKKSRSEKKTSYFLRRLIFLLVDNTLKNHYEDTYAMRCLQSSIAINLLLAELGIKSQSIVGDVCVAQVFENDSSHPNWNGFWGGDHHVWSCNEFGEVIDLTIKYLHLHPVTKTNGQLPMPAIWWEDNVQWPVIMRYLQQGVALVDLPKDEMDDLESFKKIIISNYNDFLQNNTVQDVIFHPIIYGKDSMNQLHKEGNLWLKKSIVFQNLAIPFPQQIQKRLAELTY